jgi:hypothetical protein
MKKTLVVSLLALLAGCGRESELITYVCDEPLAGYLAQARKNIENDYDVERSLKLLSACPEKGYHRRYRFAFSRESMASKQIVDARVLAAWCGDPEARTTEAELKLSPGMLVFQFTYPWSTATGKYPQTTFRLNRSTLEGGFLEDLDWTCRLEEPSEKES